MVILFTSNIFLQKGSTNESLNFQIINFLGYIGIYVVLASLCCTASLNPSIEGAFYFLIFIGAATWWAFNKDLRQSFLVVLVSRFVMLAVVVHIVVELSYQNQLVQDFIRVNETWDRYFGLIPIYRMNCSDPRDVNYVGSSDWYNYGYPIRLFLLYYVLVLQTQYMANKGVSASSSQGLTVFN